MSAAAAAPAPSPLSPFEGNKVRAFASKKNQAAHNLMDAIKQVQNVTEFYRRWGEDRPITSLGACYTSDRHLSGFEIAATTAYSPQDCQAKCQMDGHCWGWTYFGDSNQCSLAEGGPEKGHTMAESGKKIVSGPKSCGWPRPNNPVREDEKIEEALDELIPTLSMDSKIGQLIFLVQFRTTVENLKLTAAGAAQIPRPPHGMSLKDTLKLFDQLYDESLKVGDGIPVMFVTNAVHGNTMIKGATIFPHNIAIGAANDPDLARRVGEATALEMAVAGFDWTEAPTVAVARDIRWGRTYESYSSSPQRVKNMAFAMVRGLQGDPNNDKDFLSDAHVIATCKHWIGDGASSKGITYGDVHLEEEEFRDVHGLPFVACIEAGVQSIMPSYTAYHGTSMHGNWFLNSAVLKGMMDFQGFVISDFDGWVWNAVPGCSVDNCPATIGTGIDQLLVGYGDYQKLMSGIKKAVETGELPEERFNNAVRRVLRTKMRLGLMGPRARTTRQRPSERKYAGRTEYFNNKKHRQGAREAVRKSVVLLKNHRKALPIKPQMRVLVAGPAANDKTKMMGGWTLDLFGQNIEQADFPQATTVFEALRREMKKRGGSATFSETGWVKDYSEYDLAVFVTGEEPYAEIKGDLADPEKSRSLDHGTRHVADFETLDMLQKSKLPTVTILLSGRPLYVNKYINKSHAFMAAWLPGSEGGNGIADLLLGDFDFSGTLSFPWPRHPCQTLSQPWALPDGQTHLFPLGYGLDYKHNKTIPQLPENWVFEC